MSNKPFKISEVSDLISYLKDDTYTIEDISKKMNRSIPVLRQKITQMAVTRIKRGQSYEGLRARDEDINLLLDLKDPNIERIRELLKELNHLITLI